MLPYRIWYLYQTRLIVSMPEMVQQLSKQLIIKYAAVVELVDTKDFE